MESKYNRDYSKEVKEITFEEFTKLLFGQNPHWAQLIASRQIWLKNGGDKDKAIIHYRVKLPAWIEPKVIELVAESMTAREKNALFHHNLIYTKKGVALKRTDERFKHFVVFYGDGKVKFDFEGKCEFDHIEDYL